MSVKPVETRRLYLQIADKLRGLIEQQDFAPNGRLPSERELAQTLGVSRPSVREALIALEVEGMVEVRIGSGIYVLAGSDVHAVNGPDAAAGRSTAGYAPGQHRQRGIGRSLKPGGPVASVDAEFDDPSVRKSDVDEHQISSSTLRCA